MRLITFSGPEADAPLPGLLIGEHVLPLPYADMLTVIKGGERTLEHLRYLQDTAANHDPEDPVSGLVRLNSVVLHAPLPRPPSLRDFYAFEEHVMKAHANRGKPVPEEWYQFPVFYFSNANAVFGPEQPIPYPAYSQALDYELEIACIIGKTGENILEEAAEEHIFGFTIFNDWSARDEQKQEMRVGLGPAKGKDFASSFGPWIATLDELIDKFTGRIGVYDLEMVARINGEKRSRGNWRDIYFSFGQMIARASAGVTLYPGEILGSGTVGSGCLLELTGGDGPWLQPGDEVVIAVERLGKLRNTIAEPN